MRNKMLVALSTVVTFLAVGSAAIAQTTDPVQSGFSAVLDKITTYIGYAIPFVAAAVALGIGVALLVKYVRKGVRAA